LNVVAPLAIDSSSAPLSFSINPDVVSPETLPPTVTVDVPVPLPDGPDTGAVGEPVVDPAGFERSLEPPHAATSNATAKPIEPFRTDTCPPFFSLRVLSATLFPVCLLI
jgi:hypothetical protein